MRTVRALMWAKTAPVEIALARGELPDLSEYPLRVQYTDGSEELRTLGYFDNFGLKPFRKGRQTAIYRLGNYEISFAVLYREQKLTRVETLRFGKTEYLEGESIDNNDFLARASYSDGSEKTVRLQCQAKASPNMDSVQMRYGTCKVQIPIKVGKKVPGLQTNGKETAIQSQIQPACLARIAAISIHRPPRKRKYLLGKVIPDLRGGVLDVIYDTGDVHQVPMTNDMRAEPQSLDIGETEMDIFAFGCIASYEITILEPRAVRVTVEAMPTKREYEDGDLLDLSGLVLSVLYNDGSSEKVTGLNVKRDLKKGDESVRLNYMGIPFEVPVHVKRRHHEVYPVSLVMSELPYKRVYARGEKRFVPDGGVLLLQMSDGMRKVIPLSEAKIDGFATSKPGELPLIAEVQGFRCEFTLAVEEKKLVSISVSGNAKKQYYPGEAYSLTGILVFAEYDNGEREPVSDYSIDKKTAAIGDTEINFQYKGKTAVLPVEVRDNRVVRIGMAREPRKLDYLIGESITCDGGRISVEYENGNIEEKPLDAARLEIPEIETEGRFVIGVSYAGLSTSYTISATAPQRIGIEVTALPRTQYKEGETFSTDGLVISETYINGKRHLLKPSEFQVMLDRPLLATDTFVAISHAGFVTAIPIEVEATPLKERMMSQKEKEPAQDVFFPFYPSTVTLRFQEEG